MMFPLARYRALRIQAVVAGLITVLDTRCVTDGAIQQTTEDIERTNSCNVQNKLLNLELVCQTLSDEVLCLWASRVGAERIERLTLTITRSERVVTVTVEAALGVAVCPCEIIDGVCSS